MLYILFALIQFILFYFLPLTGGPTDVMGVVFLMFAGTMLNSLIMGLTSLSLKAKLLFTLVVILMFVPSVFLPFFHGDMEVLMIYTPLLAVFHMVFAILGTGVKHLFKAIGKSLKE